MAVPIVGASGTVACSFTTMVASRYTPVRLPQVAPESLEAKDVNDGVGVTEVVGALVPPFHTMPDDPLISMK